MGSVDARSTQRAQSTWSSPHCHINRSVEVEDSEIQNQPQLHLFKSSLSSMSQRESGESLVLFPDSPPRNYSFPQGHYWENLEQGNVDVLRCSPSTQHEGWLMDVHEFFTSSVYLPSTIFSPGSLAEVSRAATPWTMQLLLHLKWSHSVVK